MRTEYWANVGAKCTVSAGKDVSQRVMMVSIFLKNSKNLKPGCLRKEMALLWDITVPSCPTRGRIFAVGFPCVCEHEYAPNSRDFRIDFHTRAHLHRMECTNSSTQRHPDPWLCGVVLGAVVWGGVMWWGVVWCAEGAVTRRQWPGCLPMGTRKREGSVCSARAVRQCVVIGGKRGSRGKPGCYPLGDRRHPRSSRYTPSLSACWCRRSSCNTHTIVLPGPRRAFGNVARALAWPTRL